MSMTSGVTQWKPSGMQGITSCPEDSTGGIFDRMGIWNKLLLSYHVFKFIKCGEVPLLLRMDGPGT